MAWGRKEGRCLGPGRLEEGHVLGMGADFRDNC